ncbi:MAG: hypothetical protein EOM41_11715 [Bacilli bacterium]|nr:hypothetical protein [Bacilli bacterium]
MPTEQLVTIINNQAVVSSRQVAENFGKHHFHVLDAIEEILKNGNSCLSFFLESTYKTPGNNKTYKQYLMNRDGFTLLAMGFTGPKALQWKLKYIQAFNEMEEQLKNTFKLPQNYKEALVALVEQVGENSENGKFRSHVFSKQRASGNNMDMLSEILNQFLMLEGYPKLERPPHSLNLKMSPKLSRRSTGDYCGG